MQHQSVERGTFILLLVAVTLAFGLVISNYYGAIFWAVVLALIFMPLHRRFLKLFNGRKNAASLASLSFCLLLGVIPVIVIVIAIVQEFIVIVQTLTDPQTGRVTIKPYIDQMWDATPQSLRDYIDRIRLTELSLLREKVESMAAATASTAGKLLVSWGQNLFSLAISFCVMLYLLFFMFRDGEMLSQLVVKYVPLSADYKKHLSEKFITVVKATVKGNIVVAVIQGMLGGLAFYFFQIQGALLWAVLMSFLSLLPAVGASLVWIPAALYFLATGRIWEGIALIAWGALVIGMIDNLLRPLLIGKDTKLPDYVVLVTTLGGMSLVGINGFVLGPLVAALFIAVWGLLGNQRTDELQQNQAHLQQSLNKRKGRHRGGRQQPTQVAQPTDPTTKEALIKETHTQAQNTPQSATIRATSHIPGSGKRRPANPHAKPARDIKKIEPDEA